MLQDVLRNINLDVFDEIDRWVHESFDAITSQGKPEFAKITCSFPIVTDATSKQLFCGLVLTSKFHSHYYIIFLKYLLDFINNRVQILREYGSCR